jgi:PAS domain S-box-containing protein
MSGSAIRMHSKDTISPDFRALFESAPGLYLVLTPELQILAVSDAYLQATMTTREQITGYYLFDIFPDNPDEKLATGVRNLSASLRRALETGSPDVMPIQKYDIRRPENQGGGFEERHWSAVNSPVLGGDGKVRYIIHSVEDVTAKTQVESRFRKLLEAAPDAIFEVDEQGRIVLLNETAEKMFGYTRQELKWLSIEVLVPEAARGGHIHHRATYAEHPQTRPMGTGRQLKAQRKDGSLFPVEISLSPNPSESGLHVIAVVRDITERKQIEERMRAVREQYTAELATKNEQLQIRNREVERANRLKSEFLASMSHELRTPLHTIIGFSELMLEEGDGPLDPKYKRFIGHIVQDSRHLLELINGILDLSKIEAGKLELQWGSFEFSECLTEVLTAIRPQAEVKEIRLIDQINHHALIRADRVRVKEILYNLLSNALKFTSRGGLIWVESSMEGDYLKVTVGDTGMGIAPEEHNAIFENFYQASDTTQGVREGTGLGLAITRKLVELHSGTIWVESQKGQGSRFIFTLPLIGEVSHI